MTPLIVGWLCATLALLLLSKALARVVPWPLPTVQLVLGMAAAAMVSWLGIDSGLRWQDFHDLVIHVLLPILVFHAALVLDRSALRANLAVVLILAIVAIVVTAGLVAAAVWAGIGHPGFPIAAALITGVLLAATDPAAVTSQGGHTRAAQVLEGESLFNDGTAVALFAVTLTLAMAADQTSLETFLHESALLFAREFAGGALLGAFAGLVLRVVVARIWQPTSRRWLLLLAALGLYHAALALHLSGIICILIAGLAIGRRYGKDEVLGTVDETANGFLFGLAGFTVTWSMFSERWLAMLIGIGAVLAARFVATTATLNLARLWMRPPPNFREQTTVALFGLRGAVTLALALALPTDLPYWWTIQSIAYGVVLFDFLLLAPLAPRIARRLP